MSSIISVENLSYAYPPAASNSETTWVLDGVNLTVSAGEFVAIMGPTGSGKTTLCLALNGIVPHSTGGVIGGDVFIGGLNTKTQTVAQLARTVGLVFQNAETQLFNMTVEAELAFGLETLGLPPSEMHQRIEWALDLVGMSGFQMHSPFELSGGQMQRVAIAAILAMKPPVLILDEPTANLDPVGKREVFEAVNALRKQEGITIIMVSHESEQIAAFAQRVVVLDGGKVVIDEPPRSAFVPTVKLRNIGLSVPQVSQLADCLNGRLGTTYAFTQLDEALQGLQGMVPAVASTVEGPETAAAEIITPEPAYIVIDNLSFDYPNQSKAIRDVSLSVGKGEFIAILGQNGAGKTTLVKHLNGLLRPTRGRILLESVDIMDLTVAELARTVGYVFQNPDHMIFSSTVCEELAAGPRNLGLAENVVAQRVEETLERFELRAYADHQPALLSYGLRRKVSIAAVVTMNTEILIVDEPTNSLDQRGSAEIMCTLGHINRRGHTVIIITHDMRLVAQFVPKIVLMFDGRILARDSTRRILGRTDLLKETQLESPPITRLGGRLGLLSPVLSVTELCERLS